MLSHGYYVDYAYEGVIVRHGLYRGVAVLLYWVDRVIIDGITDTLGWTGRNIGGAIGRVQTGQVQGYGLGIAAGIIAILISFWIWS